MKTINLSLGPGGRMIAQEMEVQLTQQVFDTFYKNSEGKDWAEKDYLILRDRRNHFRDLGEKAPDHMKAKSYYNICKSIDIFLQIYEEKHPEIKNKLYIQKPI